MVPTEWPYQSQPIPVPCPASLVDDPSAPTHVHPRTELPHISGVRAQAETVDQ